METVFTLNGIEYEIRDYVRNGLECPNVKHIYRCDGLFIPNQTKVLREFLISKGYSPSAVNHEVGNFHLASVAFKVLNNQPIDIPKVID